MKKKMSSAKPLVTAVVTDDLRTYRHARLVYDCLSKEYKLDEL